MITAAVLHSVAALSLGAADVSGRNMVWAHYVAWLPCEETSMLAERYLDPVAFDVGANPKRDEVMAALDMGIDGWFIDVVAWDRAEPSHYSDLAPYLAAATGTPFMVGICLDRKFDAVWQTAELVRILRAFGSHPNFPRFGGRYVVATYTWWNWSASEWAEIRRGCEEAGFPLYLIANLTFSFEPFSDERLAEYADVFDCGYTFGYIGRNGMSVGENHRRLGEFCVKRGKRWMPGLHPGYVGGWFWGRNAYYLPHEGIDALHEAFLASFGPDGSRPQWSHITSWNDHDETTICPRLLTPGLRRLVREYSAALKGEAPRAEEPEVVFAYHREEMPGTLVRIEAMRLPAKHGGGDVVVGGELLDWNGRRAAALEEKTFSKAWERREWLVPSTALCSSPYLVPRFSRGGAAAEFPPIFFSEPWIGNQQTVRETFADRVDVRSSLDVAVTGKVLHAALSFESPVAVKRAVLYRNDRAAGVFSRKGDALSGGAQFSFVAAGPKNGDDFKVEFDDARKVTSVRRYAKRHEGHKYVGGEDMRFRLVSVGGAAIVFTPAELVESGTLRAGEYFVRKEADLGVYHSGSLGLSRGDLSCAAFSEPAEKGDVFWVRFETEDGRICDGRPLYPFAGDAERTPRVENIVETHVTLEHPQGSAGRPGHSPFLTPESELPVLGTNLIKAAVSPLASRSYRWAGPFAFSGKGGDSVKIAPYRRWPMDKGRISFEFKPECDFGAKGPRIGILWKDGVQPGFSFSCTPGGRVVAYWRETEKSKSVEVLSAGLAKAGEWNEVVLEWDGVSAALSLNGKPGKSVEMPVCRRYGNCYVHLGRGRKGETPLNGKIRNLKAGGLTEPRTVSPAP